MIHKTRQMKKIFFWFLRPPYSLGARKLTEAIETECQKVIMSLSLTVVNMCIVNTHTASPTREIADIAKRGAGNDWNNKKTRLWISL